MMPCSYPVASPPPASALPLSAWPTAGTVGTVGTVGTASHSPASAVGGLSAFLCLPFLGLCRLPHQSLVGQTLARDAFQDSVEPAGIGGLSSIVPESLFINVPEQVERLYADIGAFDGPFQEAPVVFDPDGMNLAPHICFGVVDDFMGIARTDSVVSGVFVGIDGGTWRNGLANGSRQSTLACVGNYLSIDCAVPIGAVTLQKSHDSGLTRGLTP